jgi:hypothetical protein
VLSANRSRGRHPLPSQLIVALATRHAVPAIYEWREFAEAGVELRYQHYGCISAGRHLHRAVSQGRKARQFAGRAVDQVRIRDQSKDSQGSAFIAAALRAKSCEWVSMLEGRTGMAMGEWINWAAGGAADRGLLPLP